MTDPGVISEGVVGRNFNKNSERNKISWKLPKGITKKYQRNSLNKWSITSRNYWKNSSNNFWKKCVGNSEETLIEVYELIFPSFLKNSPGIAYSSGETPWRIFWEFSRRIEEIEKKYSKKNNLTNFLDDFFFQKCLKKI